MERDPRPDKVAVVTEVRERLSNAEATVVTEYRGLNVAAMAELRRAVSEAGGGYTVYKNTLARRAAAELELEGFEELLVGPTALAFVDDDVAKVAKALREFAKTNENLVVKGGVMGGAVLGADEVLALADLPSREELLSRLAGGLQAPSQKTAQLLYAILAKFGYAVSALIDAGGATPGAADSAAPAAGETPDAGDSSGDDETSAPAAD